MLQIVPTLLTNKYSCNTCLSKLNNLDMGTSYYHHVLFIEPADGWYMHLTWQLVASLECFLE